MGDDITWEEIIKNPPFIKNDNAVPIKRQLLIEYYLNKQFAGAWQWKTLEHNGVLFPPEYKPHNIPLIYNNEEIKLNPLSEEYATLYAKYLESEYTKNKIFNKNFWNDFKKSLNKTNSQENKIESFELCDFKLIYKYILDEKEKKDAVPLEEKEKIKKEREEQEKKYKIAVVDGKEQPVGNFRVEPPGIFIGRGCDNPYQGHIKERIMPEDITINIGKEAKIPEPPEGHHWKKVIHDRSVQWLSEWKDNITGKMKYVWLASHSEFKTQSDIKKFDLARKLKKRIKRIREQNDVNLISDDKFIKQLATALYFIDKLALRVGNEKGEDETDTVGVSSLRVEHIKLEENNYIELDFLGKDSVRYVREIEVSNIVYNNLKEFIANKAQSDELFDKINSNDINKYLQSMMKDLTAKVFRTYNASNLFQKELNKITNKYENMDMTDKINLLLDEFNKANAKIAILCNHQKAVSKNFSEQIDKIKEQIKKIRKKIKIAKKRNNKEREEELRDKLQQIKIKKELKVELKNVSLGTSKINYIDPRITVAFMKKFNLPVDKIFSKVLQERFAWAFSVGPEFRF